MSDIVPILSSFSSPLLAILVFFAWRMREDIHKIQLRLVKIETMQKRHYQPEP
jgi:hypothetical protein